MRNPELTYRRLLLAYPRSYRRERGLEILTTLMDAAASGKRQPSTRDALDLVVSGLRYRLSPQHGWRNWVAAALTSVFIGLTLASIAAASVWSSSPTEPRPDQRAALVGLPTGESFTYPVSLWQHDYLGKGTAARLEGWAGGQPAPSHIEDVYRPETLEATVLPLYERMPRDGWRTGELIEWEHGYVFWASRDDVVVRVQGLRLDGSSPSITVQTHLAEPAGVTPVAIGALVLGGLAGWMVACGLSRRVRRARPAWLAAATVLAVIYRTAQGLMTVLMLGELAMLVSYWGLAQFHWLAPLGSLLSSPLPATAAIGGFLAHAVIVVAAPTAPVGYRRERVSP